MKGKVFHPSVVARELHREVGLRTSFYPKLVKQGKLTQAQAERQKSIMEFAAQYFDVLGGTDLFNQEFSFYKWLIKNGYKQTEVNDLGEDERGDDWVSYVFEKGKERVSCQIASVSKCGYFTREGSEEFADLVNIPLPGDILLTQYLFKLKPHKFKM